MKSLQNSNCLYPILPTTVSSFIVQSGARGHKGEREVEVRVVERHSLGRKDPLMRRKLGLS